MGNATPQSKYWPRMGSGGKFLFPVFSVLEGAFVMNGKLGDWEHVGSPAWMLTNAGMLTRMQAKVKSRS